MIEIKHKETGNVLQRVDADTLEGQVLSGKKMAGANLAGMNLNRCHFRNADLRHAGQGSRLPRREFLRGIHKPGPRLQRALYIVIQARV